jgi:regulator of replication initiation timing
MNKVIKELIEQIVDLKIENKSLDNYKYKIQSELYKENQELKLEITNLRLVLDELQKEKGSNKVTIFC